MDTDNYVLFNSAVEDSMADTVLQFIIATMATALDLPLAEDSPNVSMHGHAWVVFDKAEEPL